MWNQFYRYPRLLILTICLILVWGFSSYQTLPRMEDPQVSQWYGMITTSYPGANADRVEALVTEKMEEELYEVEEVDKMYSLSRTGHSTITLKLKSETQNIDLAWSRVRDKLNDITPLLPEGVNTPEFDSLQVRPYTIIAALTWELDSPVNYNILNRFAQTLEEKIRTLQGTEKVDLYGAPDEEIVVEIEPFRIGALDITPQNIAHQISLSDAKAAAGQLRSPSHDILLEVDTDLDSLEQIRQIPIHIPHSSGQITPLGDIAQVQKGIKQPLSDIALIGGRQGITLAILAEEDQSTDEWSKIIHQRLAEFQKNLPEGINLTVIFDQNRYISQSMNHLSHNLLLGVMCVIGTTIIFMGFKSALIVGTALPLSVLMVFGGMRILEIPLHHISIIGLLIALGLLIDNAIVVVDEVVNHIQKGLPPTAAIGQSTRNLAIPLLASTLTTILTFMPIVLMPGESGEFVGTLAVNVILALSFSLLISLTIIPALTGKIYAPQSAKTLWNQGISNGWLTNIYRYLLNYFLARPLLGVFLAMMLPTLGFIMASSLPEQFFPPAERSQLQIELQLQAATSIDETKRLALQAQKRMKQDPHIRDVHWFLGRNAPVFYNNIEKGTENAPNYAHGMIQLTSTSDIEELVRSLQKDLDEAFPSAQILVRQLEQGAYIAAPIELYIYGPDLAILQKLGNQARTLLSQIVNVHHTQSSLGEAQPILALSLDEEQTQITGLNNTQIAQQLNANLEGNFGGSVVEDTEELPIRVRLGKSVKGDLEQIATLDLVTTHPSSLDSDLSLPLSALGQLNVVPQTAIITRRNGQRVNVIQGFTQVGVLPSTVLAEFKERLAQINLQLPPGYTLEWGGEIAERNGAVNDLMATVGVLMVVILTILVLSFNSFRCAAIILLVVVGSTGLALVSLWSFGYPLGFMSILGTVGLIGVAINDSIVVLAAIRHDSLARQGDRQGIVRIIIRSTRHVLTTTVTTIAGFIPLLLDGGDFWPPLAICIVGGVSGATLLALFFVPCTYRLVMGTNRSLAV